MSNMPKDLNASLSSLALLSLQFQEGRDYLDYLHGFVVYVLEGIGTDGFDAATVQKLVDEQFGLKIPVATFALYLKRLAKDEIITATSSGRGFHVTLLPATTIDKDRKAFLAKIEDVTNDLAAFAHTKYGLSWDDHHSSTALTEFVRQYSINFLRYAESKSPLPKETLNEKTTDFVVASFITTCAKDWPGLFESIKVLVQSHILANAFMCPDLQKDVRGFTGVHFFLDTRFLLKALDLESLLDTDNASSLLAAIRNLKGIICVFPETLNELRAVLNTIISGMKQGSGRGWVQRELINRHRGVADVILVERDLDTLLASLNIQVFQSPKYAEENYLFQIDESELNDEIEQEIPQIKDRAAEHDVRVVRHIFALRKGVQPSTIEDAGYVFLTTNAGLSRAAYQYARKNTNGWVFSAVVTNYHLSHLVWLKSPIQAADLSRTEILANCYSTMRPHESMWNRYLTEVDRLKNEKRVSERDHEVLRFSIHAPDALMDVTRGDVEGVNEKNIHLILEKLEKNFATEKEQQIERMRCEREEANRVLAKAQTTTLEHEEQLAQAAEREQKLRSETIAKDEVIQKFQKSEAEARQRERVRQQKVELLSNKIAKYAYVFAWIVFAGFTVLSFCSNWSFWFAVPAGIVGLLNIAAGFSGNSIRRFVRNWVEKWLSQFNG